jgi:hypothetical protein
MDSHPDPTAGWANKPLQNAHAALKRAAGPTPLTSRSSRER